MTLIDFPAPSAGSQFDDLRREVREFLAREMADHTPQMRARSWNGYDRDFSRKIAEMGWVGMTLPKDYGGHGRSPLERYVVMEEMLGAGAPVAAHWIADRQSAPLILAKGTEAQKRDILPRVAAGTCSFCIGMSEPDSGSDLAATRTTATPENGGFRVNGTKLWTTYAHEADYMILFCRTDKPTADKTDRHGGMSQFLVDLKHTKGITIRPVIDMAGEHHFNEVIFDNVLLEGDALIGTLGGGWDQVMSELAFERSGPERFLSSFALIEQMIALVRQDPTEQQEIEVGRLAAHLMVLRRMSRSVAGLLDRGENPLLQATIVKDLGAIYEQDVPRLARSLLSRPASPASADSYNAVLAQTVLSVPCFSLRGGTREILRGIIARGLGLR
ncbi:MAG: acyl-CoA dehydrogenase family protein [Rhodobacteraceae bacterium]|nr:acyl-CoA dehydrogenase family protein [Paracoccaceae bacterium]